MFSSIHRRLSYANVVATLALVFAMSGGALAASHYLISSTKQISPRVLSALKGRAGAPGAPGRAGPQGARGEIGSVGKEGPAGKEGSIGKEGPVGKAGTPGKKGSEGEPGEPGPQGTTGPAGTNGKEGSPWTAGGVLPSGSTETGAWLLYKNVGAAEEIAFAPISFPIPLATKGSAGVEPHFVGITEGEGEANENKALFEEIDGKKLCKGTVDDPGAGAGNLCIFAGEQLGQLTNAREGAVFSPSTRAFNEPGLTGAVIYFESEHSGVMEGTGAWAVTAK